MGQQVFTSHTAVELQQLGFMPQVKRSMSGVELLGCSVWGPYLTGLCAAVSIGTVIERRPAFPDNSQFSPAALQASCLLQASQKLLPQPLDRDTSAGDKLASMTGEDKGRGGRRNGRKQANSEVFPQEETSDGVFSSACCHLLSHSHSGDRSGD
ncbi:unnamed protein product [Pleuronectes platessa]|uniref:Uncharacterized protein n=1 Tax=Pleuronectes platessa TaxID=8262 RepID=A0A9N7Z4Q6_PLEPL|nr:unnamed protein product [Pleuronectes platessa]